MLLKLIEQEPAKQVLFGIFQKNMTCLYTLEIKFG